MKTSDLQKLARLLSQKPDIYSPLGRIYAFEAEFTARDGKLFHGERELDPASLTDGHGKRIQF